MGCGPSLRRFGSRLPAIDRGNVGDGGRTSAITVTVEYESEFVRGRAFPRDLRQPFMGRGTSELVKSTVAGATTSARALGSELAETIPPSSSTTIEAWPVNDSAGRMGTRYKGARELGVNKWLQTRQV